jgi:hypothetical protein
MGWRWGGEWGTEEGRERDGAREERRERGKGKKARRGDTETVFQCVMVFLVEVTSLTAKCFEIFILITFPFFT